MTPQMPCIPLPQTCGSPSGETHCSASSVKHPVSRCSHYSWSPLPREQFAGESPGQFRTKGDNGSTEPTLGRSTASATDVAPYAMLLHKQGPLRVFWSSFFWSLKLN